ncbi:protein kinase [Streptomyces capillispiralis]|uniref:serine/threonine-protein kinase n=1 Tax=Streptomyces capillispiralis TaxID=68182 RepID=UPI0036AD1A61
MALTSRYSAEVLAGRYRLDALIGSGGAADVHRGHDLRLRRPVAVKVFRPGADLDMEERFRSEAVILARLHHPGLVTAYDAGRHDDRAYLVMQLIEGPTLKDRVSEGTLTAEQTAAVGAGLAEALAHAHDAGIVHRDVKPSNIILDGAGRPHLTDFGISRLLDATSRTATGTLIGTAAYLSPEQVLGRSVGLPADIYALGLVLLECLTGRLEYDGGPLEAAIARLHRPPVLPDFLTEDFAALLRSMTSLNEWERPPARECARMLTALAGEADSVPVPPATPTTSVVPDREPMREPVRQPVRDAGPTHRSPSPAGRPARPRTAAARRRTLVTGGTTALAAVLTAGLAVSDGPWRQGRGEQAPRAAGSPSAPADAPRIGAQRKDTTTVAPLPSAPRPTADPRRDAAPAPVDPGSRNPATGAAAHGTPAPAPRSGPDGTARALPTDPSGTGRQSGTTPPGERADRPETAAKNQKKVRKNDTKQ